MFNVFYYVSATGGFYSFNSRTANVLPCSKDPPKRLHDWKHNFFYVCRGGCPLICIIVILIRVFPNFRRFRT
ncbi:hypothetical protein Hanom_Chr03g00206511 [Helianthus anomalus]